MYRQRTDGIFQLELEGLLVVESPRWYIYACVWD